MAPPLRRAGSIRRLVLLLAFIALAPLVAHARSINPSALPTDPEPLVEAGRFFGGRTVSVPVPLTPPIDDSLVLRARLFQLTAALASPIGDALELPVAQAGGAGAWAPRLDILLPHVSRESHLELRLQVRRGAEGEWHDAGRVALRVYPDDLLEPLRDWAREHTLRLVDDRGELADFLRHHDIDFRARGDAPRPGTGPQITLYAGKAARRQRSGDKPGAAVIFRERELGVPHVLVDERGNQPVVSVEMALVARLDSDPRAQQTLIQIFELLQARSRGGDPR
jgi:hypothetical protein